MRIGVFGGTFDPPHIGHLILAEQAREQVALDEVWFIPAGDPWRKAGRDVTPAPHRLAMTRLAVEGISAFQVDDCEVCARPDIHGRNAAGAAERLDEEEELFLILGEDALADIPNWHEPERLADHAYIVVAPREGAEGPEALPFDPLRIVRIEMPYVAVSSTDLRARARLGRSLRFFVPEAVAAYIKANGLYQS